MLLFWPSDIADPFWVGGVLGDLRLAARKESLHLQQRIGLEVVPQPDADLLLGVVEGLELA